MIEASPLLAVIIMFSSLLVLLALGLPVVFALGSAGVMCILLLWGPQALSITVQSAWTTMLFYTLVAVPFFVFMAMILQGSGIADDLFYSMQLWFAGVPGGVAIGVVFICTIVAAMTGISATGVVTMGILALPIMLKLGYNKTIALGPILAGGALGFLIPPSVAFVLYGALVHVSIGRLFMGGIIPGLILSFLYIAYILIRCTAQPKLGPPLPPEERGTLRQKVASLKSLALPGLLILLVLGTIFAGIASPTEAAAAGAIGAVVCAAIHGKFNLSMLKEATLSTFRTSGMVMWILIGAYVYKAVFFGVGGPSLIRDFLGSLSVAPLAIIFMMQISFMILGCFLTELPIMMMTLPAYIPVIEMLGYSKIWFGVLFLVNMQMAYLTPPFGFCLFYMKGVAPPEVSMGDIYRSILPFVGLQLACLILVMFCPQVALWLPGLVFGAK